MDPFAALSLAGNIVQFVEFGIKLTIKGSEIYDSFSEQLVRPLSSNHSVAEASVVQLAEKCSEQAQNLRSILYGLSGLTLAERVDEILRNPAYANDTARLQSITSSKLNSQDAEKITEIINEHHDASDERKVAAIRKRLPLSNRKKKTSALIAAMKSLWKKKEVEEIYNDLKEYRAQLTAYMVTIINDKNSSITTLLESLVNMNTSTNRQTSDRLEKLETTLAEIKAVIAQVSRPQSVTYITQTQLPSQLTCLVEIGEKAVVSVLDSLKFDSMYAREANVSAAHSKTFEWLFDDTCVFYKWLSAKSTGSFWVSGKPGSGKSTLMKFVTRHKTCETVLQERAKDEQLITASFYFWSAGTPMQRSRQGLLQTVLVQIMRACPLLIPIIAPDRWAGALSNTASDPWTWDEALATLIRFIHQKDVKCSTCLFIDGLDEFDGDYADLVKVFSEIPRSSNMKVCLASRPYNMFADAYGRSRDRMIRLQDLTRPDIRQYVNEEFATHASFSSISIQTEQYDALVEEIVNKAEGVFLWVYLVVRSLKDGLTNEDTVSELRQRLKVLPSGLSEYFTHILSSVDHFYLEDTSKVFHMATSARYPLPPGVLSVLDDEDSEICLRVDTKCVTLQEYRARVQTIEKRLNARCKGLLELRETPGHLWGSHDYQDRYLIYFLHRTVRDFLRNQDVINELKSRLPSSFNIDQTLCQGYLLHMKNFIIADDPYICRRYSFVKAFEDLSYFALRMQKIANISPNEILDAAFHAGGVVRKLTPIITEEMLYGLVVRHGLGEFLDHRFQDKSPNSGPPLKMMDALLKEALLTASTQSQSSRYAYDLQPSVIDTLLKYGANPNYTLEETGQKVWPFFLAYMHSSGARYVKDNPDAFYEVCTLMLKAGAERSRDIEKSLLRKPFSTTQIRFLQKLIAEPYKRRVERDATIMAGSHKSSEKRITEHINPQAAPSEDDKDGQSSVVQEQQRRGIRLRMSQWFKS
ncbi:hypothetical protein F5Y16DRAFT_422566 [Xylariaceae sp. FL0255]|nr:hypothetical protein F5Y16DRAFT_422566 [Xylariaceae sp. FL0255]